MSADAHVLMHWAKRADHGPFLHGHVSAEGRAVHQHAVVSNHAVVSDVGVGHDERAAADAGEAAAFHRAAADGDVLANLIVVADLQARGLAFVGSILRRHADGGEREESVVRADFGWPIDGNVRDQATALSEFDASTDHAVRAYLARSWEFGFRIDYGGGVNIHDRVIACGSLRSRAIRAVAASARTVDELA